MSTSKKGLTFKKVNIASRQKSSKYENFLASIKKLGVIKVLRVYTLSDDAKIEGRFSGIKGYRFLEIEDDSGKPVDRLGYNLFAKLVIQSGIADLDIAEGQEANFDIALNGALGDAFDRQQKRLAKAKK